MNIPQISVLFLSEKECRRKAFQARMQPFFPIWSRRSGFEGLQLLKDHGDMGVVVIDLAHPPDGILDLVSLSRIGNPDLGIIVVGNGKEQDRGEQVLSQGVNQHIGGPLCISALTRAIACEVDRVQRLREERLRLKLAQARQQYFESADNMVFHLPSDLALVYPLSDHIVLFMEGVGLCTKANRFYVRLGLGEIISNAMEHGNLGLTWDEKIALKLRGVDVYEAELRYRFAQKPYRERRVSIELSIQMDRAAVRVEDEGLGFDFRNIPDPTAPEHLFNPSGRGILLARTYLDAVEYSGRGNVVTLVKNRESPVQLATG